jgi:asparaginyl-tRNA synthetase
MTISTIKSAVGTTVTLPCWLYNSRSSGKVAFLELRDGTGMMQAVLVQSDVAPEVWEAALGLSQEASLKVTGEVTAHPKKEDVFELQVAGLEVICNTPDYPIAHKEHGPDFLLEHRHLWIRTPRQRAILRIRDAVMMATHEYLHQQGFTKTDSPIFTPNACEGTTDLFPVEYFDEGTAYLSQSGQLYLEATIMSLGRTYDFGPVFRAEKSVTKRHLTEFWMMDAEAAFVEHEANMDLQEGLVKHCIAYCLAHCAPELATLERDVTKLQTVVDTPFTRLTYADTITELNRLGSDIKFGEDLGNDDEAILTRESAVPVFIEKWPKDIKPFYMKIDPTDPTRVLNNDLIATEGGGEIFGGSQREDSYDLLKERILEHNLPLEEFEWYLDLRKYGSVPHSGFGMGLERMTRWISGVEHVRECIPFPRVVNRLRP